MERIDAALEKRVWDRVYGRKPQHRKAEAPLGQLCSTARDCAQLYRSLRLESRGAAARRFGQMEQEMVQAARRLELACDGQEQFAPPAGCPGCSRARKLELLRLWLDAWSGRCREFSGDTLCGKTLEELARMGEAHCRALNRMSGK